MDTNKLLSVDEFLEIFPWPKELLAEGKLINFFWNFDLEISPELLWPFMCDSNRLSLAIGYEKVNYSESQGVLYGSSGKENTRQEWIEPAWNWNYCQYVDRLRVYSKGVQKYNRTIGYLQKGSDNSSVKFYIYIGSICDNPDFERILLKYIPPFEERYKNYFQMIAKRIKKERHLKPFHLDISSIKPEISEKNIHALQHFINLYEKNDLNISLAKRLVEHILNANELDLYRIRPLSLAYEWGVNLRELLEVCLYGVQYGLLQLSWDIICPHCRGVRQEIPFLSQIPQRGKCDVCKISFENNLSNSIEVVFHVHPGTREVKKIYYCSAEPYSKMHIKIQKDLPANTKNIVIDTEIPSGNYNIRIIGHPNLEPFQIKTLPSLDILRKQNKSNHLVKLQISLDNPFDSNQLFILEDKVWDITSVLKPSYLFNLQIFRNMFSDDYIPHDLNLDIGTQTIMFIDLVKSTIFYEEEGDEKAFNKLKRYFDKLFGIASKNYGAVIKTMGDGAMVAFNDPLNAIKAALEMREVSKIKDSADDFQLKISINYGKCLAVNFNSNIDYFGQTVNLSSKLQIGAAADDIMLSSTMVEMDGIKNFLSEQKLKTSKIEITHPSLKYPINGYKIISTHEGSYLRQ